MQKNVLLLVGAVLAGVLLFLLFGQGGDGDPDVVDDVYDAPEEYDADPALRASGTGRNPRDPKRNGAESSGKGKTTPTKPAVWMAGTVVDAKTRRPLAGVSVRLEQAGSPCPRAYGDHSPWELEGLVLSQAMTSEDGTFTLERDPRWTAEAAFDLFALRSGYVTACVCRASGTEIEIALDPGLMVQGRVLNHMGHPLEGAKVSAGPPVGMQRLPGTVAKDETDREGRFRLDGLKADGVMITVDHPAYMPKTVGPREPGDPTPFEIRLVPAYRVTFQVRTDDGEPVKNPTVRWTTDGDPPAEDLRMLKGTPTGPPARKDSEMKSETLRIPCDRRIVDFEINADGYMPWTAKGEPLPADGGERTYPVTLERDMTIGSLRIKLTDKDGKPIPYSESKAEPSVMWMGPRDQQPSSFVLQASDVLDMPSMQAGPYRIGVRSPSYAPAEVEVAVIAGTLTEKTLVLGPPAKLAVRFLATERMTVHFRITQNGRIVKAFPVGKETTEANPGEITPLSAQGGGESLILSGLGAGSYVIEVTSENLVATTRSVSLTPGETEEVEIEVQAR